MDRRRFVTLAAGLTGATAAGLTLPAGPAHAARPLRVLVATNEPWGTYHLTRLLAEAAAVRPQEVWQAALVVPDLSTIAPGDPVPVVELSKADAWGADLLVVNGANPWPTEVVRTLPGLPVVASSLAYLTPVEAAGAASLRPRLVALTAGSRPEADVFAAHFGVDAARVQVVGNPALDVLPARRPVAGTALIATSVTRPSATGGAAPGAELLLDAAAALAADGWRIRVGLHPREDRSLWSAYETATEGTAAASATAQVTVGIPGSVFPTVAAIGCPLVGVVADGLTVPDYILALCRQVRTVPAAVAAAWDGWRPDAATLEASLGPIGGSDNRVWRVWRRQAARGVRRGGRV